MKSSFNSCVLILVYVFLCQLEHIFVVFVSLARIIATFCIGHHLLAWRAQQSRLFGISFLLRYEDIFYFVKRKLIHMLSEKFCESKRLQLKQLPVVDELVQFSHSSLRDHVSLLVFFLHGCIFNLCHLAPAIL